MSKRPKSYARDKEKGTDTYLTPPNLIESLGEFDLDPCCPDKMEWKTAKIMYSIERGEDGLVLPWRGRVWLNPPYLNWVPFVKKLKEHGNGVALIFTRTETKGFFNHIWYDADSLLFLKKRVKFIRDGSVASAPIASVMVAFGKNNTSSFERAVKDKLIEGRIVYLKNEVTNE